MTKRRKRRRWPLVLLWVFVGVPAIAVGLLAIVNYVVMPLLTQHRLEVVVPDIVGLDTIKAAETLSRAGFRLGEVRSVADSVRPAGCAVAQYPGAGHRTKPGRIVNIDISRGPDRVAVPDLTGMTLAMAEARLLEAGLLAGEVESLRTPNLPAGKVIAARPAAGTVVPVGTPVTIAVSAPVGSFPMPNLLGMGLETASGIIVSQGLVLGEIKHAASDEPAGMVMIQYPEEGQPVRDGDTVQLIVAAPVKDSPP